MKRASFPLTRSSGIHPPQREVEECGEGDPGEVGGEQPGGWSADGEEAAEGEEDGEMVNCPIILRALPAVGWEDPARRALCARCPGCQSFSRRGFLWVLANVASVSSPHAAILSHGMREWGSSPS